MNAIKEVEFTAQDIGSREAFANAVQVAFKDASVLPNAAVYNEASRLSRLNVPQKSPRPVKIELVGNNNDWSVYRVDGFTVFAIYADDGETIDDPDVDDCEEMGIPYAEE